MASRRGMNSSERLALDIVTVTATGAVLAAPCYVYKVGFTIDDSTTSGLFTLSDTSAAGDGVKESKKWNFKVGTAGASGNVHNQPDVNFAPPIFIATQAFWTVSTGIDSVSISYLPAS